MLGKVSWGLALSALLMIGCSDDTTTPPANDTGPDSPIVDMSQTDTTAPGDDTGTPNQDTGTPGTDSTVDTGAPAADSTVDTGAPQPCDTCHGEPPNTGEHNRHIGRQNISCNTCHNTTVDSNGDIVPNGTHRNGSNDVSGTQFDYSGSRCTNVDCHGNENW